MNKPSLCAPNRRVWVSSAQLLILCASVIILLGGCVSHRLVMSHEARREVVPFIQDGNTSRAELVQRLGEPTKVFLQGKVWIYFLGWKAMGGANQRSIVVCGSGQTKPEAIAEADTEEACPNYHLVVSFGETDLVQKHSLIQVR